MMRVKCCVSLVIWVVCFGSAYAADWWKPAPGTSWQIQLQGRINTSYDVDVYDVDLFDTPQAIIDELQSRGVRVVCYFNAGGFEDWRDDADSFPAEVMGNQMDGWPGERWLDIRRIDLLTPIMRTRLDLAKSKHCDGVDPDNVDGYTNDTGFLLTAEDQLSYNQWLSEEAHARGLAVGLKNDLQQVSDLLDYFDFAINEQCVWYQECALLTPFIAASKPVFAIEYRGSKKKVCTVSNELNFDTILKKRNLKAARRTCR
jgi:hypothetical protein